MHESDPVWFLEEKSPSVLRRSYTTGDLNDVYVSLCSSSKVIVSSLTSRKRTDAPPYRPSFAAVCKYEKREGSSSRTTDRGASYRIPQPFVFAIRDYVTTMIHDDIYFGIRSARGPWSFLSYPGILHGHSFRREPRAFVHSRNHAK